MLILGRSPCSGPSTWVRLATSLQEFRVSRPPELCCHCTRCCPPVFLLASRRMNRLPQEVEHRDFWWSPVISMTLRGLGTTLWMLRTGHQSKQCFFFFFLSCQPGGEIYGLIDPDLSIKRTCPTLFQRLKLKFYLLMFCFPTFNPSTELYKGHLNRTLF